MRSHKRSTGHVVTSSILKEIGGAMLLVTGIHRRQAGSSNKLSGQVRLCAFSAGDIGVFKRLPNGAFCPY